MSEAETVRAFFEAVNRRDREAMSRYLGPDTRFDFPKTQILIGRDRILRFFGILFRQYPELAFEVLRVIHEGALFAVHWRNHGRNRRGEPYENEGVTILEIRGEAIVFISDFFKSTERF